MKILFIYPTTTTNGRPNKYRKAYLPPLNLAILDRLTYLDSKRHKVQIINECVEKINFNSDCDVVAITALTTQITRAYQIADQFRQSGKKVLIGGVHPSLLPGESLEHADSVVIGEVENIWSQILYDIEKNCLKPVYQDNAFPDLNRLMIPKWDNFDLSIYRRSFGRKLPRMPIYTTRGCIFGCNFCSVSKFFGRSYRCKPINNVLEEINSIPAESFFFTDDNIICKPDYSQELFKSLISLKKKIRWFSQSSTTILKNPYLIPMAYEAGCRSLFFGVESINPKNLRAANKNFNNPEKYVELSKRCSKVGIQPWFSMIFGFDADSLETMIHTVHFLKKHHIWNVVFWILTPLPGTDLWEEMIAENRVIDFDWSKYDLNNVVFKPLEDTPSELSNNFWATYKSMYTPRSLIFRSLYAFKTSKTLKIKCLLNSILNQYYSLYQIRCRNHPYSMGIWKIN